MRPAAHRFAPGFRGLSEGFIDFEALVAAAAGSRHCPDRRPRAAGSAACADGLLLSFAQAGYVRAEPAILRPPSRSSICRARTSAKASMVC
jgi:hypothetical protein